MDNLKVSKKSMLDDELSETVFNRWLVIDQEKILDKDIIVEKSVIIIGVKTAFQVEFPIFNSIFNMRWITKLGEYNQT